MPGSVVAPLLKKRSNFSAVLAIIIAIIILNYIDYKKKYDKIAVVIKMLNEIIEAVKKAGEIYKSAAGNLGIENKGFTDLIFKR